MSSEVSIMLCSALVVVAVWLWQRHLAAKEYARLNKLREDAEAGRVNAEREMSTADAALKAKCEQMEQLRKDDAEDLSRQAEQFRDEIRALNAKLEASAQEVRDEREKRESVARQLVASEEAQRASEKLLAEKDVPPAPGPVAVSNGRPCKNPRCISTTEQGLEPLFYPVHQALIQGTMTRIPTKYLCAYCEMEQV